MPGCKWNASVPPNWKLFLIKLTLLSQDKQFGSKQFSKLSRTDELFTKKRRPQPSRCKFSNIYISISLKYRLRYFRLDEKPNQKPSKIYFNTKGRKKPVTRANRTEHFKEVTK